VQRRKVISESPGDKNARGDAEDIREDRDHLDDVVCAAVNCRECGLGTAL
jgi:hypothetical protein